MATALEVVVAAAGRWMQHQEQQLGRLLAWVGTAAEVVAAVVVAAAAGGGLVVLQEQQVGATRPVVTVALAAGSPLVMLL
jgi:hypothetical protein